MIFLNKKQLGITLILILLMLILVTGENMFNGNLEKVALINNNIEGLNTYTALDGILTYKLPDSWDVEEKKYPGNYIIYDNNFTSDSMGLWGYVQILNSNEDLGKMIEDDKKKLNNDNVSDYVITDEKIDNELVKKVVFKEKNDKGIIYVNTIYYKELDENKVVKVLFSASESKHKEDYSIIYKAIIDSLKHSQ
ncbi:hypothetical protein [Clostridium sp. LIBA-8841]|uniref:hypothetical protein n=1 Tax=Clostridium sp. LIBA-8841 TaxID=2987530 RepID=UPI002AC50BC2|nr:hypothetical protein [Clostridium sp. LIBA-8841]